MLRLSKTPDKDFTLLNLTDLHMLDNDWTEQTPRLKNMIATLDELVERTNPDLITISGDFLYPPKFQPQDISYAKFAEWLDSYGIPWAPVWGNHDNENGPEKIEEMASITLSSKHGLFERGDPKYGCGNYIIAIEEDSKPIYAVAMLDSHNRAPYVNDEGKQINAWDYLHEDQLRWYRSEMETLGKIKSAIITHIPLYAYRKAFAQAWNSEFDPKTISVVESFNARYWNPGYKDSYGANHEGANSHSRDMHEFEILCPEDGSYCPTDIILVGHDHINSFVINYRGVTLAYSLKTGGGSYRDMTMTGGTKISINAERRKLEHVYTSR